MWHFRNEVVIGSFVFGPDEIDAQFVSKITVFDSKILDDHNRSDETPTANDPILHLVVVGSCVVHSKIKSCVVKLNHIMIKITTLYLVLAVTAKQLTTEAFVIITNSNGNPLISSSSSSKSPLSVLAATEEKAARLVSGEDLEVMLTEWDTPLVVDAYATWYVALFLYMLAGFDCGHLLVWGLLDLPGFFTSFYGVLTLLLLLCLSNIKPKPMIVV